MNHDLHWLLVELPERPDIVSLQAVHWVGCKGQLHVRVRALCGGLEKVFNVVMDTGAQVSLVKAANYHQSALAQVGGLSG